MFIQLKVENITEQIWVNTSSISTINDSVIKLNNCDILVLEPSSLRELLMSITPKNRQVKDDNPDRKLKELFEQLHKLTKGKGTPIFSLNRERKMKELLTKHRLTPEILVRAATNIGNDAWLQGENNNNKRYGDVDYLFSADKDGTLRATRWAEEQPKKQKKMF